MRYLRQKSLISAIILISILYFSSNFASAEKYLSAKGTITGKIVNVRISPDTSSKVQIKIPKGKNTEVTEKSNGWYKIKYNKTVGWVSGDFIKVTDVVYQSGKVKVKTLNLREEPATKGKLVKKLKKGILLDILDSKENWYNTKTPEGDEGWVCSDYILLIKNETKVKVSRSSEEIHVPVKQTEVEVPIKQADVDAPATPLETEVPVKPSETDTTATPAETEAPVNPAGTVPSGAQVLEFASKFLGYKYVYGGATPEEGFDCSGFVYYVFSNFGIKLDRVASDQSSSGIAVDRSQLAVGDLVFFDTSRSGKNIDHVGIYIGNNQFIHSSSPRYNVTISGLSEEYYDKSYVMAKRVL